MELSYEDTIRAMKLVRAIFISSQTGKSVISDFPSVYFVTLRDYISVRLVQIIAM